MALTVGSCAAEHHESGQIRKEAALTGTFRVPQGCLTRAGGHRRRRLRSLEGGGTITPLTPGPAFYVRMLNQWRHKPQVSGLRRRAP